jgi:AP-1 complex subunit beta-1
LNDITVHVHGFAGEIQEFKQELNNPDRSKRKDAVKRVIAAMTVGKDVSSLFPDVVNCMQTEDTELKKLVYLYLINYAKTQPELTILAVNTFVKDSQDPNPLIRALAVRTMGCIRVDRITEYLCDPLERCLKDQDPYVRKTAAVCVAKLFDINAELVAERGFLESLLNLVGDANPMVVANAVAALSEIYDGQDTTFLDQGSLTKLLRALNECTEWGQVFILDAVSGYDAVDGEEAEMIVERIIPRLQHANPAVVLSAVKVILNNITLIKNVDVAVAVAKKLAPPLVTLLSAEPEIQYVALRCINLVIQRVPEVLEHEVRVFFCKYNDPIYVKIEKLEIMVQLAREDTVDQVLLELKEYATEVDVDFVRKSVRAIGRCAIGIESAAERCVNVLVELIETRVSYVVQEAIIVVKDIFRRYPNRYESIISTLCENLDSLDEPEARASIIWIIGEYAERIDNADEILEQFLESFPEEPARVQLQLMTATVKLFLKKPSERPQQLIQLVLTYSTQETDDPDLRDRAYIYWRLLSTDPDVAKRVVLAEKPVIENRSSHLDPVLLSTLLEELGSLSSVFHKASAAFVSKTKVKVQRADDLVTVNMNSEEGGHIKAGAGGDVGEVTTASPAQPLPDLLGDLLDLSDPDPVQESQPADQNLDDPSSSAPTVPPGADLLGGLEALEQGPSSTNHPSTLRHLTSKAGLDIRGQLEKTPAGDLVYNLEIINSSDQPLDGFLLTMNKNPRGLTQVSQKLDMTTLHPHTSHTTSVKLTTSESMKSNAEVDPMGKFTLQLAMKNNQQGVIYFTDEVDDALFL